MYYNAQFHLLGSFKNAETELLSGKIYHVQNNRLFWMIFLSIVLSISLIGSLSLFAKRYLSFKANLNRVQKIHITLEEQIQNEKTNNNIEHQDFNTRSYNSPLLNCHEILVIFSIPFFSVTFVILPVFINFGREQIHQNIFYTEIIVEYVVGIAIPLYVLMKKKAIRVYFWNHLQNLFSYTGTRTPNT